MHAGAITFSDLVGWLKVLTATGATTCSDLLDKLVYDHGPQAKLIEWFSDRR